MAAIATSTPIDINIFRNVLRRRNARDCPFSFVTDGLRCIRVVVVIIDDVFTVTGCACCGWSTTVVGADEATVFFVIVHAMENMFDSML